MSKATAKKTDPREEAFRRGLGLLDAHGLFRGISTQWTDSPRLAQSRG
jgi:hypothetical protein